MAYYDREPTWQIILNAARELNKEEFTVRDIVKQIRNKGYIITENSIQKHLIGMAPNHPSSIHQPFLRDNFPVFNYLGKGLYKINENFILEKPVEKIEVETVIVKTTDIITDSSPMIINPDDLGEFYILISNFEKELREIIKLKLGKGIYKRLKNELPDVLNDWEERKNNDKYWGIQHELDLINYALLTDYMMIIRKYKNIFTIGGDEELNTVLHQLKQFATYGRNPLMHCRTLSLQKYYTTISSVNYLKEWIKRIQN